MGNRRKPEWADVFLIANFFTNKAAPQRSSVLVLTGITNNIIPD